MWESRLPVGSSAKMISGYDQGSAMATRCCWPRERCDGRCFCGFSSSTILRASTARSRRSRRKRRVDHRQFHIRKTLSFGNKLKN